MRMSTVGRAFLCIALVFSVVIIGPSSVAEAGGTSWHWLNPLPRGETLKAVDMVDASIGYAVGNDGCLMKTYDGGKSWVNKSSGTTEDLSAVSFVSADTGWVGGTNGVILKTSGSSGATWVKQTTGVTDGQITAIHFRDSLKGWACDVGGRILRTIDGGASWQTTLNVSANFNSIYFVSDLVGFAVTSQGTVYKSTDGGATWPPASMQTLSANSLTDITFKPGSDQIGWISVNAFPTSAFRTSDGGATWTGFPVGSKGYWHSVSFAPSSDAVWFAGFGSQPRKIARVADSATPFWEEWEYATYGTDYPLYSIDSVSADRAVAVGHVGMIIRTSDGGTTWAHRDQTVARTFLRRVQFLDLRTGYIAAGDGKVYKSTNAGKSWAATNVSNTDAMLGLHFLDVNQGWAVGNNGKIFKTTNGAASWTEQTSGTTQPLNAVFFADASRGWAISDQGWVLYTDNGGASWARQGEGTIDTMALYDVEFYSATEGAIVGAGPRIYVTKNGGATWTSKTPPAAVNGNWNTVDYVAPDTFFVAGEHMSHPSIEFTMLKTTNGGDAFMLTPANQSVSSAFTSHGQIWDMQFKDANNGWVVFGDGFLGKTSDGGLNWTYEQLMDAEIRSISVVSASAIWVSAPNGRLMSNYWYTPTTVYRFYNIKNGTHFYTASATEMNNVKATLSHIYQYEGVGYVYDAAKATKPLYRFYHLKNGSHFYTASATEKANVQATLSHVYQYEGPAYNISTTKPAGATTVWRFYNLKNGSHFYTASATERDYVKQTWPTIYQLEGEAFYLPQ